MVLKKGKLPSALSDSDLLDNHLRRICFEFVQFQAEWHLIIKIG